MEAGLRLSDASRRAAAVHIVQPGPDSVLYLSPELAEQAVLLKASGPPGTVSLEVRVDGAMVGHVPIRPLDRDGNGLDARALAAYAGNLRRQRGEVHP